MSHEKGTLDALRIDRSRPQPSGTPGRTALLATVVVLLLALAGWLLRRPSAPLVRVAAAREIAGANGPRTLLNASGYVTARRDATVSSKVTGKVVEVMVEEGMKVEAGQILARLDPSNVEASLRLAEAQAVAARSSLSETRARLEEAERELRRARRLSEQKIATQAELDRAEAEVKSLQARLERQAAEITVAERETALWQQQLEDTVIRAPFTGIVTSKNAQPGEMISPVSAGGGFTRTGICTIVDMNSLEVEVDVNESFINRVEAGQRVEATLDSYPDWKIPSKVIAIIPTADRQKATVKVRVGFDKLDPRILPDMGVKVAFQAEAQSQSPSNNGPATRSLVVPKSAIRQRDGRSIVWVVRNRQIERRAVTVGDTRNDETTIAAGLNSGERIIIEGPETLADGMRIREKP